MNRKMAVSDWVGISGAHVLLLAPCTIFAVFVIPTLSVFLAIPFALLLGISLLSLNLVFFIIPGYIPLNSHPQYHQQQQVQEASAQLLNLPEEYPFVQASNFGQDRVICVDGRMLDCKYCFTCQSMRPPRTYHCSSCDRCIYGNSYKS